MNDVSFAPSPAPIGAAPVKADNPIKPGGAFFVETVTWVQHWTESLFSFRTTRDPALRFASGQFAAEPDAALPVVIGNLQIQRIAGIKVPDLDGIDLMPMANDTARQQEIDGRHGTASTDRFRRRPESLPVEATLGVGDQLERGDDLLRRYVCNTENHGSSRAGMGVVSGAF